MQEPIVSSRDRGERGVVDLVVVQNFDSGRGLANARQGFFQKECGRQVGDSGCLEHVSLPESCPEPTPGVLARVPESPRPSGANQDRRGASA